MSELQAFVELIVGDEPVSTAELALIYTVLPELLLDLMSESEEKV